MITRISAYIMPLVILIIVGYGLYKKSDNYDNFIKGAADGMKTVVDSPHACWTYGCGRSVKVFRLS